VAVELSSNDVIVVGTPSVLSVWGFALVRAAAAELAHAEICTVDRADEAEAVPASSGRPRVFCLSQYPSPGLVGIIRSARVPVIAFLDEPTESVRYLKDSLNCSFLEGLRAQTAAATVCSVLRGNRRVVLIHRSAGGTVARVVAQVLDQLGVRTTAAAMKPFVERFVGEPGAAAWPLESALSRGVAGYVAPGTASSMSPEEAAVVGQVLAPMMLMAIRGDIEPICWPSSVFLFGDRPNERAPLVAELTGAARIIFYGPYFHLPAGRWQVRIFLGFSHDIFGTPLSIEVHGSALVAKALVKPEGEGIFRVSFSMVHERAQDALELRVRNEEGAIEGRVGLSRVQFFPEPA
jgi:hypothetical protein